MRVYINKARNGPYYIEATANWDGKADSDPTDYVFHDTAENVRKAYAQGRDIKLRVKLIQTGAALDAVYTLMGAGDALPVYFFALPVSTYENSHMHAIALFGGFEASLLVTELDDGTLGLYDY